MADMSKDEALLRMRAFLQAHFALNSFPGVTEALATLEAHLAAPAALTRVEVESAQRVVNRISNLKSEDSLAAAVAALEADRAAIATAAKLEGERIGRAAMLNEIERRVRTSKWINLVGSKEGAWGRAYLAVMSELRSKLTAEGGE